MTGIRNRFVAKLARLMLGVMGDVQDRIIIVNKLSVSNLLLLTTPVELAVQPEVKLVTMSHYAYFG